MYPLILKCESRWATYFPSCPPSSWVDSVFIAVWSVCFCSLPWSRSPHLESMQTFRTLVRQSCWLTCDVLIPTVAANNESCSVSLAWGLLVVKFRWWGLGDGWFPVLHHLCATVDVEVFTVTVSIWYNCQYSSLNLNPFHLQMFFPVSNAWAALVNIYLATKDLSFV